MSSLDSDIDSTIISNSEGSENVKTDQWDFEETVGDKISDGNAFGVIVEPYPFEPYASDSEEEGGSEDGGVKRSKCWSHVHFSSIGFALHSIGGLEGRDFVSIDKLFYIQWGEQVFDTLPILQVFPLTKHVEVCNF